MMGKSLIVNTVGAKTFWVNVPAGNVEAQAFADAVLDGTTKVFEGSTTVGSDAVDSGRDVNVMVQNETTGAKTYMRFIIDSSKHEGDVIASLEGKTFNGVLAEKVVIIGMRTVQY